ncbi:MAG: hypothetical protein ACTSRZ_02725, partial [Promethearchaeota archaeon]
DQKRSFMILNRTRKSTRRQFYWLLASILYNGWQTQRTIRIMENTDKECDICLFRSLKKKLYCEI